MAEFVQIILGIIFLAVVFILTRYGVQQPLSCETLRGKKPSTPVVQLTCPMQNPSIFGLG